METPLKAQAATPDHASTGVVMPLNYRLIAARQGHDPAELDMQVAAYGWKVGTHTEAVPPVEPVHVDMTGTYHFAAVVFAASLFVVALGLLPGRNSQSTPDAQ